MYIMKDLLKNKKLMFLIICISLVLANSPDANMKSSSSVAIASQTTPGLARNGPPNKDSPSEQKPTNESNDDVSNLEFQRLFNISRSFHKIPVNSYHIFCRIRLVPSALTYGQIWVHIDCHHFLVVICLGEGKLIICKPILVNNSLTIDHQEV